MKTQCIVSLFLVSGLLCALPLVGQERMLRKQVVVDASMRRASAWASSMAS